MNLFKEVHEKQDVPNTSELPQMKAHVEKGEDWQNAIELPDDVGGWQDSVAIPDERGEWQDHIKLDSGDIADYHNNAGIEKSSPLDSPADNLLGAQTDSHSVNRQLPDRDAPQIDREVLNEYQSDSILDKVVVDETICSEMKEGDYPSSYKERIGQTPRDDGERGEWQGERGESMFIPNDNEVQEVLEKDGVEGIVYKNAIPDFFPCSKSTVEIDYMSDNRNGPPVEGSNFQQCDQKCATQWNEQCRGGKNDWTARDVANWRRENGYSWHERNDMKTCDLIPTKVNAYFGHLGGVGEYIRLSNSKKVEDVFDE